MGKLDNKVALITGCSGGIGKETAIRFAQEGANLAICARTESKLLETKEICEKEGAKVIAIRCDVGEKEQLENFVNKAIEAFGTIDILVNNAVDALPGTPFMEQSEEYVELIFNSAYLATWRLMKLCYPYLKTKGGSIINFASASGILGNAGFAAYGSMKEAIRGLTKIVAREWGKDGIHVNCIAPTAITPKIQEYINEFPEGERSPERLGFKIPAMGRVGTAYEDITPILVFMASEDSAYITGQTINADGGSVIF